MTLVRPSATARWHIIRAEADGMTGAVCGRGWKTSTLERADTGDVLEGLAGARCHRCATGRPSSRATPSSPP